MRLRMITSFTGTLLVAGLASMAYASAPAGHSAANLRESINSPAAAVAVQQDQEKPKQDETKPPKEKKNEKAPKGDHQQVQPKHQDTTGKNQSGQQRGQDKQPARDQRQANGAHPDNHGSANGGHGRIPDNDFKAHFGRDHHFAVRQVITTTRIVPNQTQFVYGGYSFIFLDPWPADWSPDDDCYIDYEGDEYYLIDLNHPGMQIALSVVIG